MKQSVYVISSGLSRIRLLKTGCQRSKKKLKNNGKKIAIIGAGPSGLTCAYYMQLSGYNVEVFEAESVAGGVLAYGIPEYRLPKAVLAREVSAIEATGVKIHLNTEVGKDVTFDELCKSSMPCMLLLEHSAAARPIFPVKICPVYTTDWIF